MDAKESDSQNQPRTNKKGVVANKNFMPGKKKARLKELMRGDTVQITFNKHVVNGFYAGSQGIMIGSKYTHPGIKKMYISHPVLKNIKAFRDYRFSMTNPRMVLIEKRMFDDTLPRNTTEK